MNTNFYNKLEETFSRNRLSAYRQDGADDETCIARYLFNIEICKSLYPILHIFEITFRNSIDKALVSHTGVQTWYDVLSLDITEAKAKLKKHGKPVSHDGIISELTLGFWTAFFTKKYSNCAFQSVIIKKCFEKIPRQTRNVKSLQKIFEKIRLLRNRVSHYERLIHWKDLTAQHLQLFECIRWLSDESYGVAM